MKQAEKQAWVKDYFLPAGSFLIGLLGLSAQRTLPAWIVVIAAVYLVIVAGAVLYPSTVFMVSKGRRKWKLRYLAKSYFPELLSSLSQFPRLMVPQNSNTLLYTFDVLSAWDNARGKLILPSPEHLQTIRDWTAAIEKRAKQRRYRDFPALCSELSSVIQLYNRMVCQWLEELQRFLDSRSLEEAQLRQVKQHWNKNRDLHVAFISYWAKCTQKVNERRNERLCVDYYEQLGTLE